MSRGVSPTSLDARIKEPAPERNTLTAPPATWRYVQQASTNRCGCHPF